jgi:hypothetical protein
LEKWNAQLTGYATFDDYAKAKIKNPTDPRQYENAFKEPYINGEMYNLTLAEGFKEVLTWTKNNEAFTTGVKEQMDWRASYLNPKEGLDVRSFFKNINTTFDYAKTNIKTKKMLIQYLKSKIDEGYKTVVYTDDKLKNCQLFKEAIDAVKQQGLNLNCRIYHILNSASRVDNQGWYTVIGNLKDLLKSEKLYL